MKYLSKPQILVFAVLSLLFSCDEESEIPGLRTKIDYSNLTADTSYPTFFVNANGVSTVDLAEGNARLKMFQALNHYSTSAVSANEPIDATKLENMFSNNGNPFSDISTLSVSGAELNSSGVQLRNTVASSLAPTGAEAVRAEFEGHFTDIELASQSVTTTASPGVAGKLGSYLLDEKGIEIAQVIQKSLIGALQVDYIGNVLLDKGLSADNSTLVSNKNYTQLEHNWDEAYGLLTLNPIYLENATDASKNTVEFGAGSYIWEYNKANYANIYPAFLKGRAAIVNNDKAELHAQAIFIRTELEKTLANAALGYLEKWKTGTDDAKRAHAIGEALGFIYSLRFAHVHGVDAAFSDGLIQDLVGSTNGFWDLDAAKINAAADAIKAKFKI
jgi:FlaG/FlaF family flagellin (archaellin)